MFHSHQEVYRTPCSSKKTQSQVYNCDLCDEGGWLSETDMQIHRKDGHFQELWDFYSDTSTSICLSCTIPQKDSKSLVKHIKTEHLLSSENALRVEREIFICYHCSHIFFNKTLLKCHMMKHILPRKKFQENKSVITKCPKCKKRMKLSTLWSHMEYHRLQSVSVCPICLEKCLNKADLKQHLNKHAKYYYCNMCGYNTVKHDYFKDHVRSHKQKDLTIDKDLSKGMDVGKYFLRSIRVFRPSDFVQYSVKGLKLFNNINICLLCREICTSVAQMKRHILLDHQTKRKVENKQQHVCACGEKFFNNVLLKQHMFKNHQSLTPSGEVENAPPKNYVTEVDINEIISGYEVDDDSDDAPIIIEAVENGDIIVHVT